MLESELEDWHRIYIPSSSASESKDYGKEFHGMTILDVGAGCGETAQFYLLHGASHVVCIESDPVAIAHLNLNFGWDNRVTIIPKSVDITKIDIEGSEEWLTVETHFPTRFHKFRNPFAPDVNVYRIEKSWLGIGHRIRTVRRKLHVLKLNGAHTIRRMMDKVGFDKVHKRG